MFDYLESIINISILHHIIDFMLQVNRPGFAKLFFDAASEERHHAKLLIEYLMMRGAFGRRDLLNAAETKNVFIQSKTGAKLPLLAKDWNVTNLIRQALLLENEVTKSINGVINACEKDFNVCILFMVYR